MFDLEATDQNFEKINPNRMDTKYVFYQLQLKLEYIRTEPSLKELQFS